MDNDRPQPLEGQVAVVTGGGRGIGRAIALALAATGAEVAICARSVAELEETATRIEATGRRSLALTADVTSHSDVERVIARTEAELGPVDLLVNNAGMGGVRAHVWEANPKAWWRTQEVNLLGPFLFARAVLPSMLARGRGRIVNVGSYAGVRPTPGNSAYSVSKAALLRFSDSLDAELGDGRVRVFAMSPGLVRTAMTRDVPMFADLPEEAFTPIDVGADLIVRLASGQADALGGRMIHASDDLDALIADAEELRRAGRYQLRLFRGLEDDEPA